MFQIRFHGRGGQGVVTAAEMLSVAAFLEGRFAQAFPSFGSERMGAPVISYCRIDDKEIRLREPIGEPDAVIIQDPTLLNSVNVFAGLKTDGYLLINSTQSFKELGIDDFVKKFSPEKVGRVPATELALEHIGRPVPNAALLGGLAAMTGIISQDSVIRAIKQKFSGRVAEANITVVKLAYEFANTQFAKSDGEASC
ncbi:MAG: 2-oxoacid:acceptor oxidoreductase family protein [Magnetococcales bacterium]|nr:2-oxoacid:acceptor oxidoreductase family protein [Magnetococcales bacterium]